MTCSEQCLAARIEGDTGYTWQLGNQFIVGAHIGGALMG